MCVCGVGVRKVGGGVGLGVERGGGGRGEAGGGMVLQRG